MLVSLPSRRNIFYILFFKVQTLVRVLNFISEKKIPFLVSWLPAGAADCARFPPFLQSTARKKKKGTNEAYENRWYQPFIHSAKGGRVSLGRKTRLFSHLRKEKKKKIAGLFNADLALFFSLSLSPSNSVVPRKETRIWWGGKKPFFFSPFLVFLAF